MIDIVTYIVKIIEDQKTHLTAIERDFPDEQDFYSLLEQVERFDLTPTDQIAGKMLLTSQFISRHIQTQSNVSNSSQSFT